MNTMFKEYGITKEEVLTALSDAINFVDRTDLDDNEQGLSDRLFEVMEVFKALSAEYDA